MNCYICLVFIELTCLYILKIYIEINNTVLCRLITSIKIRGVKLNYKRGLMAVLLIVCFVISIQGVSAAKLIDSKTKTLYNDEYGYGKIILKAYSYGSNHVTMKKTYKYVVYDYPEYNSNEYYTYDFKKISKTKLKVIYKDSYGHYDSYIVYTKKSAVSYYKTYRKYYA